MPDLMHRFLFDHTDIRGEVVTLTNSYQQVLANNPLPDNIQHLLGEFLAATSILSSILKFDGILTLQVRGDGPLSLMMAECTHHKELRAIAQMNPEIPAEADVTADGSHTDNSKANNSDTSKLDSNVLNNNVLNNNAHENSAHENNASLSELFGKAVLVITIDPDQGERYQGIVPMEADSLAGCLEHYFAQSEQLSTRFWLAADSNKAAGLMLQALPQQLNTSAEENQEHWNTAIQLADTVKDNELLSLDHVNLLYRLFNEQQVRLFEPLSVQFKCSCSRARSINALISLGQEEVMKLVSEQDHIAIDCQFCNQNYRFGQQDMDEIFSLKTKQLH